MAGLTRPGCRLLRHWERARHHTGGGAPCTRQSPATCAQAARPLTRVDSRLAADLRAFRAEIADLQAALAALPGEQQKTAEAIQAALEQQTADREKITAALGDLRALVEAQAAEIAGLREELQEARRPWWRRIIGGGGNG